MLIPAQILCAFDSATCQTGQYRSVFHPAMQINKVQKRSIQTIPTALAHVALAPSGYASPLLRAMWHTPEYISLV